jgi:hypothetical protein
MRSSKIYSVSTLRSCAVTVVIFFGGSIIFSGLISCASNRNTISDDRSTQVPDELSLRADRSAMENDRKDIPEEKRRDNDELAMVLQMMQAKANQEPGEIRERFNKAVRDRRDKSDKSFRRRREDYDKVERKSREAFLKKMKNERDHYMNAKHSSDDRKEFFDSQEDTRKDYFATESDQRHDFDSKLTEDRQAFDDYVKEKTDQFNEDIRAYTEDFYDRKKNIQLQKESKEKARAMGRENSRPDVRSGQSDELDEFSGIPQGPGINLGTPGDNQ